MGSESSTRRDTGSHGLTKNTLHSRPYKFDSLWKPKLVTGNLPQWVQTCANKNDKSLMALNVKATNGIFEVDSTLRYFQDSFLSELGYSGITDGTLQFFARSSPNVSFRTSEVHGAF